MARTGSTKLTIVGVDHFGRHNEEVYTGTCQCCNRLVKLAAYETRAWFVFILIPLIPLSRRQIIHLCPACGAHARLPADRWDAAKQLTTSGAMARFRADPNPDTAIEMHQQLLSYIDFRQAEAFRASLVQRFPASARIQVHLGGVMAGLGREADSAGYYRRALELRPDLPEARVGVAEHHLRENRPDEARALLGFMEERGGRHLYPLDPLARLIVCYQQLGRHDVALEILEKLLADDAPLGEHGPFRALVQTSETALGKSRSILVPLPSHKWRWLLEWNPAVVLTPRELQLRHRCGAIASILVTFTALLVLGSLYLARHRELRLLNATGQPAVVTLGDRPPVQVPAGGMVTVGLAEGDYQARVAGPVEEEFPVQIHTPWLGRWHSKPAWILNVAGAGMLVEEHAVFRKRGASSLVTRFHFGERMVRVPRADRLFAPMPRTVHVNSGEERHISRVDLIPRSPLETLRWLVTQDRFTDVADLAEWHLRLHPTDTDMAQAYAQAGAHAAEARARAVAFFESGLTNRPVSIPWHRAYLALVAGTTPGSAGMATRYDAWIREDPTNASLHFMKAHVAGSPEEGRQLLARAAELDPDNPHVLASRAYGLTIHGEWDSAAPLLERALQLLPEERGFQDSFQMVLIALGEYDKAGARLRRRIESEPWMPTHVVQLCGVLGAQGRKQEGVQTLSQWVRRLESLGATQAAPLKGEALGALYYSLGDFGYLIAPHDGSEAVSPRHRLFGLVERGRLSEAADAERMLPTDSVEPGICLGLSLGFALAGNPGEQARWLAEGARLASGGNGPEDRRLAELLRDPGPWEVSRITDLALAPRLKATLLALSGLRTPGLQPAANKAAGLFNFERVFPYHLVERVRAASPAATPGAATPGGGVQ